MKSFISIFLINCLLLFILSFPVWAITEDECLQKGTPQDKINCWTDLITQTNKREESLKNEIIKFNANIALTSAQIQKTQGEIVKLGEEIDELATKIGRLEESLGQLSNVLLERIIETYIRGNIKPIELLFSANGFSDFLTRLKYIRTVQSHDKKLMFDMQETKDDYTDQRQIREEKKIQQENLRLQLEKQKVLLAQQMKDKETLLEVTRNDERRYQDLLSAARAEQEALLRILAGQGEAAKVGDIKSGDSIGTIISGASPCSTGTHLHFEVVVSGSTTNPANYLKNISLSYDYNTGNIPEFINPTGSWDWPVDEPIMIEQIYGMSYWARVLNYYNGSPHSGIDMVSKSSAKVKAVRDGILYRGGIACGGGTLPFVRVDQSDNIQTYYLHIY
ncbi:MAG: hypothetical protein V1858_03690 [Candidatus Gottesmanbacteria bacterium]